MRARLGAVANVHAEHRAHPGLHERVRPAPRAAVAGTDAVEGPTRTHQAGAKVHQLEDARARRGAHQVVRRAGRGRVGMTLFRKKAATRADSRTTCLYYASDVHGSEPCWRKFVGAARFYEPNALIMGGDLVGKAIIPIEHCADGLYRTRFLGEDRTARDATELEALE